MHRSQRAGARVCSPPAKTPEALICAANYHCTSAKEFMIDNYCILYFFVYHCSVCKMVGLVKHPTKFWIFTNLLKLEIFYWSQRWKTRSLHSTKIKSGIVKNNFQHICVWFPLKWHIYLSEYISLCTSKCTQTTLMSLALILDVSLPLLPGYKAMSTWCHFWAFFISKYS